MLYISCSSCCSWAAFHGGSNLLNSCNYPAPWCCIVSCVLPCNTRVHVKIDTSAQWADSTRGHDVMLSISNGDGQLLEMYKGRRDLGTLGGPLGMHFWEKLRHVFLSTRMRRCHFCGSISMEGHRDVYLRVGYFVPTISCYEHHKILPRRFNDGTNRKLLQADS